MTAFFRELQQPALPGTKSVSSDLIQTTPERSGKGHGSWSLGVYEVAGLGGEKTEPSLEKHQSLGPRRGREESEEGKEGGPDRGQGSCGVC